MELFIVPPTPETEKMLNTPAPELNYPPEVHKDDFRKIPGGTVDADWVFHPAQTLGIDRIKMPQFKDKIDFLHWIMGMGVKVERVNLSPSSLLKDNNGPHLAFAQNSIYVKKAKKKVEDHGIMSSLIILSQENIIVDGNHHWLALMDVAPDQQIPMFRIQLPFQDIIAYADNYPKVTHSA